MKQLIVALCLVIGSSVATANEHRSPIKAEDVRATAADVYGFSSDATWDNIMLVPARLILTARLQVSPEAATWDELNNTLPQTVRSNIATVSGLPRATPLRNHLLTIIRRHHETELDLPKGTSWHRLMVGQLRKIRPKSLAEAVLQLHLERAIFWEEFDEEHIRPHLHTLACTNPARCT